MPDFSFRSNQPELMDAGILNFPEFSRYLKHLEYINRLTYVYRPALQWLKNAHADSNATIIRILDVASGRGDMARHLWQYAQARRLKMRIIGIDINPHATRTATNEMPENADIAFETWDVFSYDPVPKPDYIFSIQFTHHLSDEELEIFIRWMDKTAQKGWFINDLHRHPLSYYLVKFMLHLLPVHPAMRKDGPLSVAKAFTRKEWERLLEKAGVETNLVEIKWRFPFRYSVACRT